jgi:hypothetical protein
VGFDDRLTSSSSSGDAELGQAAGLKRELSPMDEVAALDDWSAPPPASKKHDSHGGEEGQ